MTPTLLTAIKSFAAAQGADALTDTRRVDEALPVFANREIAAERRAFLACLASGLPAQLRQTGDAASRASLVSRAVQALSGKGEASPALAREIAALVESLCPAGTPRPRAAAPQPSPAPRPPAPQSTPSPAARPSPPAKTTRKTALLIAAAVIAVIGLAAVFLALNSAKGWRGYSSFEAFAKAADMDEFLGKPLDEEGFAALMGLLFLGSFASDEIGFDIVSGEKLGERYGVPAGLRRYSYLVKKNYLAYYNGEVWIVVHIN
jgi:hypothetical protein